MDMVTTNRADAEATANEDAHRRIEREIAMWNGGQRVADRVMAHVVEVETAYDPKFGRRFIEAVWVSDPDAMAREFETVRDVLDGAGYPVAVHPDA